jgi:hypothetical protein
MEATRLTPHIEKNLAQEVLGKRLIADEPKKPAVDVGPMPSEQSLHRWLAPLSRLCAMNPRMAMDCIAWAGMPTAA